MPGTPHNIAGSRLARSGMSILEVSVALVVLTGALLLTVGQYANVTALQRQTETSTNIDRVVRGMVERINAVTWSHLSTTRAPWSLARYEAGGATNPPIAPAAADPDDDLQALGLAENGSVPADLRIFVEYYRAVDFTGADGVLRRGLLQDSALSTAAFRQRAYATPGQPAQGVDGEFDFRAAGWSPTAPAEGAGITTQTTLIDPTHPVVVRIVAAWDYDNATPPVARQRREVFTARAP